jgi:uncharacterized protein (TIGR02246 family)
MKLCLVFALLIAGMSIAYGQELSKDDSLQIVGSINDWNDSWNTKDHVLAAKWYNENARFTNAFGDTRNGRAGIEALLKHVFSLPFVMAGKSNTVDQQFQLPSEDVVLVHTTVEREGQKMPDGALIAGRRTSHLRVFKKESSGWKIHAHLISDARDKENTKH